MFFERELSCPFSKVDFEILSDRSLKGKIYKLKYEFDNNRILKTVLITTIALGLYSLKVYATGDINIDKAGNNFITTARKGLKWVCITVSIFGLYIGAIKDDKKKAQEIVIACLLIYLGSYLVPWLFDWIDKIFS